MEILVLIGDGLLVVGRGHQGASWRKRLTWYQTVGGTEFCHEKKFRN